MVEPSPLHQQVAQHYSQSTGGDLLASVLAALEVAGTDLSGELRYEDMGGVDHFHGGALAATRTLAKLGELTAGERVLDMGGGFGGPARTLAAEFGCHVTVLDPTEPFIQAGQALTERLGLQDAVQFFLGSGLDMPFGDERFDVVWNQNASMNIPDKARLVAEQRRVLRHVDGWSFRRSSPVPAVISCVRCPGHVIQPRASWFHPSRSAPSCVRLVSSSESGFR